MKTPIQKLFMIIEQSTVDYRDGAENLIDELISIKQEMLEKERDLIKEAFYAGGQAYSFKTIWLKEADAYLKYLENR